MVLWTEHPHLAGELRAYLDAAIAENEPHSLPLDILPLAKGEFINIDDGKPTDPQKLRQAVLDAVCKIPQIAALLAWETDILSAAGETLAELSALVPAADRHSGAYPAALDAILSRLARETVGCEHVDTDPRAAIAAALAPILSDRIVNQQVLPGALPVWQLAVTRYNDPALSNASPVEAGRINRMLHLALKGPEAIRASDWGAVVPWPFEWDNVEQRDLKFKELTGLKSKQMVCGEFRLRSSAVDACRPVLVRVGAACDYAQYRPGPIIYLFGLIIPESSEHQMDARAFQIEDVRATLEELGQNNEQCLDLAAKLKKASPSDAEFRTI